MVNMMNKIMMGLMLPQEELPSPKENKDTTLWMMEYWRLGPEEGSPKPGENKDYWVEMSKVWDVSESTARNRLCANCEYFCDTPKMLKAMESIPYNEFDTNGGGRGFCKKFDFICHNLRVCQAWEGEEGEFEEEEG